MDYRLLIMDCGLLIMVCGFLIIDYALLIMDYGPLIMDHGFIAKSKFEVIKTRNFNTFLIHTLNFFLARSLVNFTSP